MDQHLVWLLILLVIGVVVSNLMVLKYTSKFKWPTNKDSSTDKKTPDNETSSGAKNNEHSKSDRSP